MDAYMRLTNVRVANQKNVFTFFRVKKPDEFNRPRIPYSQRKIKARSSKFLSKKVSKFFRQIASFSYLLKENHRKLKYSFYVKVKHGHSYLIAVNILFSLSRHRKRKRVRSNTNPPWSKVNGLQNRNRPSDITLIMKK